jgi:putative transposase
LTLFVYVAKIVQMPRTARAAEGGVVYHVLNRGNNRERIFHKDGDFAAFIKLLIEGRDRAAIELFAFCLMSNHWHLVLRPRGDGDLAKYLSWVTNTHVKRYRAHRPSTSGHLYQGRYKSFPIKADEHLLAVLRYVEANPLRAKTVERAELWDWSSIGRCAKEEAAGLCSPWPVDRPSKWKATVNQPQSESAVAMLRTCVKRDRPYGPASWVEATAKRMGLLHTLRTRGRQANES